MAFPLFYVCHPARALIAADRLPCITGHMMSTFMDSVAKEQVCEVFIAV